MLGMADGVSKQQRDGCILYGVPYSEHSSYTELCEFIKATRPRRIVPTVNNHNPAKVPALFNDSENTHVRTAAISNKS